MENPDILTILILRLLRKWSLNEKWNCKDDLRNTSGLNHDFYTSDPMTWNHLGLYSVLLIERNQKKLSFYFPQDFLLSLFRELFKQLHFIHVLVRNWKEKRDETWNSCFWNHKMKWMKSESWFTILYSVMLKYELTQPLLYGQFGPKIFEFSAKKLVKIGCFFFSNFSNLAFWQLFCRI